MSKSDIIANNKKLRHDANSTWEKKLTADEKKALENAKRQSPFKYKEMKKTLKKKYINDTKKASKHYNKFII